MIEHKGTNYGRPQLDEKFWNHKEYIESKYKKNGLCKVGYCVLKATRLSQKLERELGVKRSGELYFKHHKDKKEYKVGESPVFFVKRG